MKKALEILAVILKITFLPHKCVANSHDACQIEVPACNANKVGQLAVDSLKQAGEHFNMRCPLDGEYKIGGDWSETH